MLILIQFTIFAKKSYWEIRNVWQNYVKTFIVQNFQLKKANGSKVQKILNEVLEIVLDQYKERERQLANGISLFAFPRVMLLLIVLLL